jgi:formylglycine-generating enzyme required for sulfatase activity
MQANFVRGRGNMMGVSGALNDRHVITNPVDAFGPNDFGLYNMAGNVN